MKIKCIVCGKRFMPDKESTYLVCNPVTALSALCNTPNVHDAVDCPRCGCQQLLKIRVPKIEEGGNGK